MNTYEQRVHLQKQILSVNDLQKGRERQNQ